MVVYILQRHGEIVSINKTVKDIAVFAHLLNKIITVIKVIWRC